VHQYVNLAVVTNDSINSEALSAEHALQLRKQQQDRATGVDDQLVADKDPQRAGGRGRESMVENVELFAWGKL
jgi:hypothetical protein